jgi:hypothetical protein
MKIFILFLVFYSTLFSNNLCEESFNYKYILNGYDIEKKTPFSPLESIYHVQLFSTKNCEIRIYSKDYDINETYNLNENELFEKKYRIKPKGILNSINIFGKNYLTYKSTLPLIIFSKEKLIIIASASGYERQEFGTIDYNYNNITSTDISSVLDSKELGTEFSFSTLSSDLLEYGGDFNVTSLIDSNDVKFIDESAFPQDTFTFRLDKYNSLFLKNCKKLFKNNIKVKSKYPILVSFSSIIQLFEYPTDFTEYQTKHKSVVYNIIYPDNYLNKSYFLIPYLSYSNTPKKYYYKIIPLNDNTNININGIDKGNYNKSDFIQEISNQILNIEADKNISVFQYQFYDTLNVFPNNQSHRTIFNSYTMNHILPLDMSQKNINFLTWDNRDLNNNILYLIKSNDDSVMLNYENIDTIDKTFESKIVENTNFTVEFIRLEKNINQLISKKGVSGIIHSYNYEDIYSYNIINNFEEFNYNILINKNIYIDTLCIFNRFVLSIDNIDDYASITWTINGSHYITKGKDILDLTDYPFGNYYIKANINDSLTLEKEVFKNDFYKGYDSIYYLCYDTLNEYHLNLDLDIDKSEFSIEWWPKDIIKNPFDYHIFFESKLEESTMLYYEIKSGSCCSKYDSIYFKIDELNPKILLDSIDLCSKDSVELYLDRNYQIVEWSNGDNSSVTKVKNNGVYSATITDFTCTKVVTINLDKYKIINPKITTSQNNFCYGDSTTLSLDKDYETIIWNTGESTKDIIVKESGVYSATVTQGECTNDTNIVINVNPLPTLDIEAPNGAILCDGGSIILEAKVPANTKITWNDGTKLAKRTVSISGTYTLTAEDIKTGCKNTKSIVVTDIENLKAEIQGDLTFCDGESTTLTIQPQGKSYLWNTGETTQSIVVNQSGVYSATITTDTDCKIDAEIEVEKLPLPTFQILGETIICKNSTTIYPDKDFEFYEWSNGETSKSITLDKAGNYELTATDSNGCKATQSIEITESTPEINLSNRNIDFSELLFGDTKSENITSDRDIILTKNSSFFDVNYSNKNIQISFNPKDIGQFIDTLIIENIDDCKALDTIYIKGICKAEILAKVSNSEAYPGDLVNNTVNLELLQDIPLPKDFNYEINIQINQDAIQIQDATTFNYKNNKLEINIEDFINKIEYDEKVKEINSKLMLTKNLENELQITKFETDNPFLIPIRQNGNIKIYEVCLYEARLIENYNEALIGNITKTNIALTTYYAGKYEITISDITGKTLYQKAETTSDNEEINFNYYLTNGTYIIKINEPGKTQTRKIVFVE